MSSELHNYVIQDAREYRTEDGQRFPCIPDINNPVLAVPYILEAWLLETGKDAKAAAGNKAEEMGIVVCEIKRHKMVNLSDVQRLIVEL